MLYQIREAQRAVLKPLTNWADSMSHLYGDPYSPLAVLPFANRISAGFELLYRLGKDYEKPEFGLSATRIEGTEVPVVERVEMNFPFCRLLKFERLLPKSLAHRSTDPTVVVFAPLSGHHATLLRDTVRALLPDHNVYISDWIDARMVSTRHGPFHLDDYIGYAIRFIRHLGPNVHVMSVCQPTVPVMAAVSIMASMKDPHQPRSMTMMGGPIDTRSSPTKVNDLATNRSHEWFERTLIHRVPSRYPGAGRRVYPGFLQHAGFVAMNPDRHVTSHWDFYLDLLRGDMDDAESHRRFYDEYNAVLDMPAEYYLDTIRLVFQEHALPRGIWEVEFEGKSWRVNPADITDVALFTIEGEIDDISGLGQTEAAQQLCSGLPERHKQHLVVKGAGHYGIFSGRRWREMVCPEVRAFIQQYDRAEDSLRLAS
jgi:poly(3-hydroxybutyrate) depolymerase